MSFDKFVEDHKRLMDRIRAMSPRELRDSIRPHIKDTCPIHGPGWLGCRPELIPTECVCLPPEDEAKP